MWAQVFFQLNAAYAETQTRRLSSEWAGNGLGCVKYVNVLCGNTNAGSKPQNRLRILTNEQRLLGDAH